MIRTSASHYEERGAYTIVGTTGTMAAGLGAAAPVFSFRWATETANAKALIDRIHVSIASLGTGFTAGLGLVDAIAARGFSGADTDGTTLTLTTNNAKRKTGFGTTLLSEARISTTATLTAGTRTLDAQAFAAKQFTVGTATNTLAFDGELWRADQDTFPLMLTPSEGFILRATVPATGTWRGIITIDWREVLG